MITGARKPQWLADNLDNPLRDWDGRAHISRSRFLKATAQYKTTRQAVLAALSAADDDDEAALPELTRIGRDYAEAFNRLDSRSPFIETEEREELFTALDHIARDARALTGKDHTAAVQHLITVVAETRNW